LVLLISTPAHGSSLFFRAPSGSRTPCQREPMRHHRRASRYVVAPYWPELHGAGGRSVYNRRSIPPTSPPRRGGGGARRRARNYDVPPPRWIPRRRRRPTWPSWESSVDCSVHDFGHRRGGSCPRWVEVSPPEPITARRCRHAAEPRPPRPADGDYGTMGVVSNTRTTPRLRLGWNARHHLTSASPAGTINVPCATSPPGETFPNGAPPSSSWTLHRRLTRGT